MSSLRRAFGDFPERNPAPVCASGEFAEWATNVASSGNSDVRAVKPLSRPWR